jgi:hypothetical protein
VCVSAFARARGSTYRRRGQTDRDKEHFRTRARAHAGRDQGPRAVSVAAGKERRRRTRGRVTPECPRFLLSVASLLSLARSVPLALTRVPQSSPSHRLAPSLAVSFTFSLSAGYSPSLGYTLSLFFLYFLCPPLVQMARTISRRVVPHGILRE